MDAIPRKRSDNAQPPPGRRRRYRLQQFVAETGTSKATVWRRIKDGTLKVEYFGDIPFIVDGPAMFFPDE
jgi:hypothetical protein